MSLKRPSYRFRMVFLVLRKSGKDFFKEYWKQEWANPRIESSVLYLKFTDYCIFSKPSHSKNNATRVGKVEDGMLLDASIIFGDCNVEFGTLGHNNVRGLVLVTECVTSNHNFLLPAGHNPRDVLADNRLAEHFKMF